MTEPDATKAKGGTDRPYTPKEFDQLPIMLSITDVARTFNCSNRWVYNNAKELGGVMRARKWRFPKSKIAELAGIE